MDSLFLLFTLCVIGTHDTDCNVQVNIVEDRQMFEYKYRHMAKLGYSPHAKDVDSFKNGWQKGNFTIHVYPNDDINRNLFHQLDHIQCRLDSETTTHMYEDVEYLDFDYDEVQDCNERVDMKIFQETGIKPHQKTDWTDPRCKMVDTRPYLYPQCVRENK